MAKNSSKDREWPPEEELARMRRKLARAKVPRFPTDADPPLYHAKFKVCEQFLVLKFKRKMSSRELARELGIAETRVSEILKYRVEKFTLDWLITQLQKLNPKLKLKIA